MKSVKFKSNNITIAAHLFLPEGEVKNKPAIVVSHPGGAVKEQASGMYARRLAEKGFVTLAFDAAFHGESEGNPRGLENPWQRIEDIKSAVAYLATLEEVDPKNIGVLGICASGGYTLVATATDHNIKALATVSGVDIGDWYRKGSYGNQDPSIIQGMLDAAAADRISVAKGNEPGKFPIRFTEEQAKALGGIDYEGYLYYSTPIGECATQTNEMVFSNIENIAGFYSPHFAALISPRPVLMIAGSNAQTLWMTKEAYEKAKDPKELFLIDGATHVDLYYKEEYVSQAIPKLAAFFEKSLK